MLTHHTMKTAPEKHGQADDALARLMSLVSPISAAEFGERYASDMKRGALASLKDAVQDLHRYLRDRTQIDRGEYVALKDVVDARYAAFSDAVELALKVQDATEALRDSCAPDLPVLDVVATEARAA